MLEQEKTGWMRIKMSIGKSAERFGKKILAFILKILIRSEEISPENITHGEVKRILVVHQDRKIGNFILTTPLIEATKKIFSIAAIDIFAAENLKVLCDDNPSLNSIYIFNHRSFIKNPFKLFKLLSELRRNNYDLAIESSNPAGTSFLNGWITYISKAKYRVGFNSGSGAIFTNVHVISDASKHYHLMKQELVNSFSKQQYDLKPKIFVDANETELQKITLKNELNIKESEKIIGLWIGARDKKKWSIENFKTLYQKVKLETNLFPLLIFGLEEENDYQSINKEEYSSLIFDDLNKLKTFISSCNIFICGDTGPLHFSFALGVPTIGIFLQDNYGTYGYADGDMNFIIKPAQLDEMIEKILESINKIKLNLN
jgi:heptosyltransferase-2/heptosyltransferase-3